jgi:hypothetical protein
MVIFGAGASADSLRQYRLQRDSQPYEDRPPLSDELFDTRFGFAYQGLPTIHEVAGEIADRPDGMSVEQKLEEMQAEAVKGLDARRWTHLMAIRFYLRRLIYHCDQEWPARVAGRTNYVDLVGAIRRWSRTNGPFSLVTFNYDLMLDVACQSSLDLDLNDVADYVSRSKWILVKPHGSANWVRTAGYAPTIIGPAPTPASVIRSTDKLMPSNSFQVIAGPEQVVGADGTTLVLPALTIPVQAKAEFECPSEHVAALGVAISNVTHLLVIGWRGAEQHFWKLWANTSPRRAPKVHIVTSSGDPTRSKVLTDNLDSIGARSPYTFTSGGFTRFVEERHLDAFLAE